MRRWIEQIYRFLLLAYPSDFRREYGREMTQVFRSRTLDLARNGSGTIAYAFHILWDWLKTLARERMDTMTRNSKLALAVGVIPAIVFTLHDLVFQLPDNEHEASLGFFLTVGGLLFVWGASGYLAARSGGVKAGAIAGAISVAILAMTFFILNNLFIDRMSYEPDRIRAFQESGYPTMRAFVNHGLFDGFFPILMTVAAIAGTLGAAIRRLQGASEPA
jgi:hypothetical protein